MPVTSSEFVYWGGFHVFSSYTPAPSTSVASTWIYWGGFHVFQLTTLAAVTTSTAGAAAFRHLITQHHVIRAVDIRF